MREAQLWRCAVVPAAALAATLAAAPAVAAAQAFPALGGLEVRGGAAFARQAKAGPSASADLDLGSLGIGSLRVIAGANYFHAPFDAAARGTTGSYNAYGGRLGLRLDLFGTRQFSPYLRGAVTGHQVDVTTPDARERDLLRGFYAGASLGGGAAYAFDSAGRTAVTAEYQRALANNIGRSTVQVGLRFLFRGDRSYARPR